MSSWQFDRGKDPLFRDAPLRYAVELPVLGVPVRFESNVADALEVVEQVYGQWRVLVARPDLLGEGRALVRIMVQAGDENDGGNRISSRLPDKDRLLLHTSGSVALADARDLNAIAYVTRQCLLADHFRNGFLDALTLFLVTALDRHPVHAAAVVRGGAALLLAGRSGVGKSTLAYVAHRAGCGLLSEDTTYVQSSPKLRVWGLGGAIFLPSSAREHFPEVAAFPTVERVNGDWKTAVPAVRSHKPGSVVCERMGICVLERAAGPSLETLLPGAVAERLGSGLEPGFDRFADTTGQVLERVASGGAWQLGLSERPQDNVKHLRRMFAHLGEGW